MAHRFPEVRLLIAVKSATLEVLSNYLSSVQNPELVAGQLLRFIVGDIMSEYCSAVPEARCPEVMPLLEVLCRRAQDQMAGHVATVFSTMFYQTVTMINEDFEAFPAFRIPFYSLVDMMVDRYLPVLETWSPEEFVLLMDTLDWGGDHPGYEVCRRALETTATLFQKMSGSPNFGAFMSIYYYRTLHHLFAIIIDPTHKCAFDEQVNLLGTLLALQTQFLEPTTIAEGILDLFQQRDPNEVLDYVGQLIGSSHDKMLFRTILRNFLVTNRRFRAADPDLNQEELAEQQKAYEEEYKSCLTEEEVPQLEE
jgi:hypothetical protein